jgi:hypothetical protein
MKVLIQWWILVFRKVDQLIYKQYTITYNEKKLLQVMHE